MVCEFEVGQGYAGEGFYTVSPQSSPTACANECIDKKKNSNSKIAGISFQASTRGCWCRINMKKIRSSDTQFQSCFIKMGE